MPGVKRGATGIRMNKWFVGRACLPRDAKKAISGWASFVSTWQNSAANLIVDRVFAFTE